MLFILTSIGFFLWSIKSILFWVSLWQIKEYRLDRLLIHVKETRQGRGLLYSPFFLGCLLLIGLYIPIVFHDTWIGIYHVCIFIFFAIESGFFIKEIIKATFKRPALTTKAAIIFTLTLLSVIGFYILMLLDTYVWMLLGQLIIPSLVALFVFGFSFPTELYRDYLIQKAQRKLSLYKNILVIGVSGSVGKTSTKEYLYHILSRKFEVVKTPLSNNTPIAIAQTILQNIQQSTEIFIVEIGSYKKGEVTQICKIVHPKISITTALGEQHISLYGSLNNIIQTEAELLHALPKGGISLVNANNDLVEDLIKKSKRKVLLYGTQASRNGKKVGLVAKNITVEKNGISFSVLLANKTLRFHTQLLGRHHIENILPAIYLAKILKMKDKEIVDGVESLTPFSKTMKKFTTQEGVILIDDSFNASPESVFAAADYLSIYQKKKIFVLMPLIELGKKASEYHYRIGKALAFCDFLLLTNKNFYKDIVRGVREKKGKCQVIVGRADRLTLKLSELTKKGDVVLFEGKEAGIILSKIL